MKRISLLLAVFCLGLVTASLAVAKTPPGKGTPEDKGKGKKTTTSATATDIENCKPKISVILKGKFMSGSGSSFTMDVTQSNSHGRDLSGTSVTLMVDEKTRFVRRGPAELGDFEAGDRLNVQARACKKKKPKRGESAPAPSSEPAAMLAKRVVGRPANPAETAGETTTTTP